MLESIMMCARPPCIHHPLSTWPFVNTDSHSNLVPVSRAPCLGSICLLETSIDLLPDPTKPVLPADHVGAPGAADAKLLGDNRRNHYLNYPPSHAVDGRPETAFCSFQGIAWGHPMHFIKYLLVFQRPEREIQSPWMY
jgi:hypothetical protein